MSVAARLDSFQRRHRWAGLPLAVIYKYADDKGYYLAALITYYGFLSLFPLLLLLVTILGYALEHDPGLRHQVLDSALSQIPVIGGQVGNTIHPLTGNLVGLVVGIALTLYGGLGVAQAGQYAMNTIWAVTEHRRPDPLHSRLRGLLLLLVVGVGVLVTTGLSALTAATAGGAMELGWLARVAAGVISIVLNSVLFVVAFRVLTARRIPIRQLRLGAGVTAVGWQMLQVLGAYYVRYKLANSTATYGVFGIVLGLLAWIYLGATLLVSSAELNVVLAHRLWPRNLLTPFIDNVALTEADRESYTSYSAQTQRKSFQNVEVSFDERDEDAPAPAPAPPDTPIPKAMDPDSP